jgi:hypothetical protein
MMPRRIIAAALLAAATAGTTAHAAGNAMPPPPPQPRMEFTALIFLFPWASAVADMLDPIDINAIEILFDTIEDPDAFDNPPHG